MWRYISFSTLLFIFLYCGKCFAESPHIYISEIMWNGSSVSTADEWIELYNPTDEIIDLENWKIFNEVKGEVMTEIQSGQIPPKGNFLISNNSKDYLFSGGGSILNIDPDVVDSAVSLSNEKLQLSLKNRLDEVIDSAGNGLKPFFYETQNPKASIARSENCMDGANEICWALSSTRENLDSSVAEFATPHNSGAVKISEFRLDGPLVLSQPARLQFIIYLSSTPESLSIIRADEPIGIDVSYKSLSEYLFDECPIFNLSVKSDSGLTDTRSFSANCVELSDNIFVSEAMPDPSNSDEWIEIANGGDRKVILKGWSLKDLSGRVFFLNDMEIDAFSYVVIYSSTSKLALNNTDERIFLLDPLGREADSMEWSSSSKDRSVAKWGDKNYQTYTPTPGKENIINNQQKLVVIDKPSKLENSLGKKITAELSKVSEERGFLIGEILAKPTIIKYDKKIEIGSNSRYRIESIVESENPLIVRILSISPIGQNGDIDLSSESEMVFTKKKTKTKITTKRNISKKKIKGIKSLERPPNGFNDSDSMVKLLVVITFCYCGVIYAIYCKQ